MIGCVLPLSTCEGTFDGALRDHLAGLGPLIVFPPLRAGCQVSRDFLQYTAFDPTISFKRRIDTVPVGQVVNGQ